MYPINTIAKINARATISNAYKAQGTYTPQANGSILLTWTPPGKRRQNKTVAGTEFLPQLEALKTKKGKISDRTVDNLIESFFLPPAVYDFSDRGAIGLSISRTVGDGSPTHRVLGKKRAAQLREEIQGITVPVGHTKKRAEAISRLVETYWSGARARSLKPTETAAQ